MAAAARRFALIAASLVGGTAAIALFFGLLFGASVSRSLSVGWYVVGSVLLLSGFFVGNRGPARPQGEGWSTFSLKRWVRWASPDEQRESLSLSALLVVLGVLLIVLGVLADTRYALA
jgi:uncharacterized membrane protein HdeD (DUF308 family)